MHRFSSILLVVTLGDLILHPVGATQSVARQWNEENLAAIRIDIPHPPVHARNLFHVAVAMYDSWAAYDTTAIGYIHHERIAAVDVAAARREAISYAAYRILISRYQNSANAEETVDSLESRMAALGYDASVTTTVGSSPAALGNRIAASILTWGLDDGSNELGGYEDGTYVNTQPEFRVIENGVPLGGFPADADPDHWHPLTFDEGFAQNGEGPIFLQSFVGATWKNTRPFSLRRTSSTDLWFDPGAPPKLRQGQAAEYRQQAIEVLLKSRQLGDMEAVDISPANQGNHPLGTESGAGRTVNPSTGQPYAPVMVPRGDYGRVLSEYWADGPSSETPPGHWHAIANEVSEQISLKQIGGTDPVVDALEWDVKLYFALSGATHDAACAAWSLKNHYESPRPITMIRFMSLQGQSSDPNLPSYHVEGMPLIPGLIDVVTEESLELGGDFHESDFQLGEVLVFTWPGRPVDPTVQRSLPRWIRGIDWFPYQDRTFVSPAFPGYISGHSAFSRAAAEVLTEFTGSEYFPGGLGGFTAPAGTFLDFEFGPSVDVSLQWATFYDAADEAGASRRWGGIHPIIDDLPGRTIGSICGRQAWSLASRYWDGSILNEQLPSKIQRTGAMTASLEWEANIGLWYTIERSTHLGAWQAVAGPIQATANRLEWSDLEASLPQNFYRLSSAAAP